MENAPGWKFYVPLLITAVACGVCVCAGYWTRDQALTAREQLRIMRANETKVETRTEPTSTTKQTESGGSMTPFAISVGTLLLAIAMFGFIAIKFHPRSPQIAAAAATSLRQMGEPTMSQTLPTGKFSTLGFQLMLEDCVGMKAAYSKLEEDYPDETRKPLEKNSWPWDSDKGTWTYPQLRLFHLCQNFNYFQVVTKKVWSDFGWPDVPPIVGIGEQERISQLLIALDKHSELLRNKIDSIRRTKGAM